MQLTTALCCAGPRTTSPTLLAASSLATSKSTNLENHCHDGGDARVPRQEEVAPPCRSKERSARGEVHEDCAAPEPAELDGLSSLTRERVRASLWRRGLKKRVAAEGPLSRQCACVIRLQQSGALCCGRPNGDGMVSVPSVLLRRCAHARRPQPPRFDSNWHWTFTMGTNEEGGHTERRRAKAVCFL